VLGMTWSVFPVQHSSCGTDRQHKWLAALGQIAAKLSIFVFISGLCGYSRLKMPHVWCMELLGFF